MNRILLFFTLICLSLTRAQTLRDIDIHNTGWAPVDSYQGARFVNLTNLIFQMQGTQGLNLKNWSISVRATSPITNGQKTFPPEKIKFQFNQVLSYNKANHDGIIPTTTSVGASMSQIPLQQSFVDLITYSPYSLHVTPSMGYFTMTLSYDVVVEGGAYLEEYKSWNNYPVYIALQFRNASNGEVFTKQFNFSMRIYPNDTPPNQPQLSLTLAPLASNVLLEFKTPSDYANGVSQTFPKALAVTSNAAYKVEVNTLSSQLTSTNTMVTLPASAVKLTVKDNSTGATTGIATLNTSKQTVITSQSHATTKYYDTTYSTQAGDTSFFNKPTELYSGTVIYTISTQ